jgi:shikimate kinase
MRMVKNSIALIGFMATGKSTVGKVLVEFLGKEYKFIETDQMVIQFAGKPIPKIFEEDGEKKFREYESIICDKISKQDMLIVSCGGGIVLNENNIMKLKKNCYIVLLKATPREIYERIIKDGKETRPIIDKEDPKAEIAKLLYLRKVYYENAAEIVIETTRKKINDIVKEIIAKTFRKT